MLHIIAAHIFTATSIQISSNSSSPNQLSQFRHKHLQILGDNAKSMASRICALTAKNASLIDDNATLRSQLDSARAQLNAARTENDSLRAQLSRFKPIDSQLPPKMHISRPPSIELVEPSSNRAQPRRTDNAAHNLTPRQRFRQSFSDRFSKWTPQPSASMPSVHDSHATRPPKRSWIHLQEPPLRDKDEMHRFASSRATKLTGVSRFARGAASSAVAPVVQQMSTVGRELGAWQRKVSSVPRPSATPDRLGRRPVKRLKQGLNPVAPRW